VLLVCCGDPTVEVSMSERTVLTERMRQFTEMVDRMEASLAYVERLIAWLEREPLAPREPLVEAERAWERH
jgi:hypothetical protein